MLIQLTTDAIDVSEALQEVRHPSCGAVATFEGDIRESNQGKSVRGLEYEVYEGLFHNVVRQIIEELKSRWTIHEIALIQRVGKLKVGDLGIVISVSSAHRRDALEALSYAIEEFKKRAPVWKKESTLEGDEWINWSSQT